MNTCPEKPALRRATTAILGTAAAWAAVSVAAWLPWLVLTSFAGTAAAQGSLSSRGGAAAIAAPRGSVFERDSDRPVAVDWTRGMILAVGAATGDLRAPSPAIARLTAQRRARAQAHERLLARASALQVDDQTIAVHARDEQVAARLRDAVDHAIDVAIDHGSDGSIVLTAGLPLEAVRLAVTGIPTSTVAASRPARKPPTAILIDARGVLEQPALGLQIEVDGTSYAGPAVFYRELGRARLDSRAGERVIRGRATGKRDSRLLLATGKAAGKNAGGVSGASIEAAATAGALVIIVIGKAR